MKNVILIGMPACGKSTLGVLLAKVLGVGFYDTDLCIQQRENRLLQDIIDADGIEHFLDVERDAILSLECENAVVATGGSAVFRAQSMEKLKRDGIVVFLDVSLETVKRRLQNIKTRGVAASKSQSIDDIYYARLPLYKKYADITVSPDAMSMEEAVSAILLALKKQKKKQKK